MMYRRQQEERKKKGYSFFLTRPIRTQSIESKNSITFTLSALFSSKVHRCIGNKQSYIRVVRYVKTTLHTHSSLRHMR